MIGFIAWLTGLCNRRRGAADAAPAPDTLDRRELARRLTQELDAAVHQGKHHLAEQIAASAMRIAALHPHLSERIARLRLSQGDPESALRIIESCLWQSASLRLLRANCWLSLGRRHEAHLDLQQWCRRAAAPLAARQLLALLEHRAGDDRAAIAALLGNLKQIEDPATLCMLTLIGVAKGRLEWAGQWVARLQSAALDDRSAPLFDVVLSTIGQRVRSVADWMTSTRRIEMLSIELAANEALLPALVAAQRIQPNPQTISLLISSITRALPSFEDRSTAMLALEHLHALITQPRAFIEAHPLETAQEQPDVLATIGGNDSAVRERAA